jgi:hypothetical protein
MLRMFQCYADPNRSITSSWNITSSQGSWLNKFASTGEQGSADTYSFKARNSAFRHRQRRRKRRTKEDEI